MSEDLALRTWREHIERELQRAPHDRHHPWRTPSLATVDGQGGPQSRTVVLRAADPGTATLRVYTDRRSPKVHEIARQPRVALLFWNPRSSLQLRIQATAQVFTKGAEVESAWARIAQSPSRGDYLSERAPGDPAQGCDPAEAGDPAQADALPGSEGPQHGAAAPAPTPSDLAHHLAIIECRAWVWDALSLSRDGHRRAAWTFPTALSAGFHPTQARWLTP